MTRSLSALVVTATLAALVPALDIGHAASLPSIKSVEFDSNFSSAVVTLAGYPSEEFSLQYDIIKRGSDRSLGAGVMVLREKTIILGDFRTILDRAYDGIGNFELRFAVCQREDLPRLDRIFGTCSPIYTKTIEYKPQPTTRKVEVTTENVFQTAVGDGAYDEMTYDEYLSEVVFTPTRDITVQLIQLDAWLCNGECFFYGAISTEKTGKILAKTVQRGIDLRVFTGVLDRPITLYHGSRYLLTTRVLSTMAVGIRTAGSDPSRIQGHGSYELKTARSSTAEHGERGPIAFTLVGHAPDMSPATRCRDTDSGKDYEHKGTVMGGSGKLKHGVDTCSEEAGPNGLFEYICWHNQVKAMKISCAYGCKNGRCVVARAKVRGPAKRPTRGMIRSTRW